MRDRATVIYWKRYTVAYVCSKRQPASEQCPKKKKHLRFFFLFSIFPLDRKRCARHTKLLQPKLTRINLPICSPIRIERARRGAIHSDTKWCADCADTLLMFTSTMMYGINQSNTENYVRTFSSRRAAPHSLALSLRCDSSHFRLLPPCDCLGVFAEVMRYGHIFFGPRHSFWYSEKDFRWAWASESRDETRCSRLAAA